MNQSGGVQGGASAFSGLSDVAISSPSTGQVPVYNSGTSKWENGDVSATDSTKLPLAGGTMTGAINVATGASHQRKINNVLVEETKELGGAAGPPCRVLYDAAGGNAMTVTNSSGIIYQDLPTPDFRVRNAAAGYARIGGWPLTPSDMPYSAVGATFANDGNWYNLYSLAQGTHNGEIKIACALFQGLVTFTINGTSISLINDGWGGSYADTTAASGKIAFRVSGGCLQINVGTGISSTPRKFLAIFNGTVN